MNRRNFIKYTGLGLLGAWLTPKVATSKNEETAPVCYYEGKANIPPYIDEKGKSAWEVAVGFPRKSNRSRAYRWKF